MVEEKTKNIMTIIKQVNNIRLTHVPTKQTSSLGPKKNVWHVLLTTIKEWQLNVHYKVALES